MTCSLNSSMIKVIKEPSYAKQRDETAFDAAINLGREYHFDEPHSRQVARLSASLFDQLEDLHRMVSKERRLLITASILHDIGACVSYRKHHKHSMKLISMSKLPGFMPRDILLTSNIARYHRKSEPSSKHTSFARLTKSEKEIVTGLAAILRMADALDRGHSQRVHGVMAAVKRRNLTIRLIGEGAMDQEREALKKKKSMFERVYKIKVRE
jgi:exopolyphosphatase / guanosine-5'-triphosphate,3'-diphosphate pyrophosphatase